MVTDAAISVDGVWKRFRRGTEGSLRDAIPALARRFIGSVLEDGLRKREFWALRDVSFQVRRGEALGIIGPNGAGKSTMLKILSRILRPNRGAVTVNGRVSALIEVAAGFHPDLTGRENVYLNGSILGMTRREIDRKYDEIVDFAGIPEFMDTPVKRYSSGMYARLGFSVAAHMDPDVLLVDEVLAVGDMNFQAKCIDRMHQFVREGTTVVFVSHNLRAVARLCPTALLLAAGRPLYLGKTSEAIRRYFEAWTEQNLREVGPEREVAIVSADLLDGTGAARAAFAPGERAAVVVTLRFNRPASRLVIGCFVRSEDQALMLDTTSAMLGVEPLAAGAGAGARLTFDLTLNLAPGTYQVGANVNDQGRRAYLDYRDTLATFVIESDGRALGAAYLDPACRVDMDGAGGHQGP